VSDWVVCAFYITDYMGFIDLFRRYTEQIALEDGVNDRHPYIEQVRSMPQLDISTLYVDYKHVLERDEVVALAVREQYYRFLPYLRRAVVGLVREFAREFLYLNPTMVASGAQHLREFSIAFYNLPLVSGIRELRTSKIGELISISGTVTRTSEVRPELLFGTFRCELCQGVISEVEQQFKYTEVCCYRSLRVVKV
jgi:DNA replication licensing factor MCM6